MAASPRTSTRRCPRRGLGAPSAAIPWFLVAAAPGRRYWTRQRPVAAPRGTPSTPARGQGPVATPPAPARGDAPRPRRGSRARRAWQGAEPEGGVGADGAARWWKEPSAGAPARSRSARAHGRTAMLGARGGGGGSTGSARGDSICRRASSSSSTRPRLLSLRLGCRNRRLAFEEGCASYSMCLPCLMFQCVWR